MKPEVENEEEKNLNFFSKQRLGVKPRQVYPDSPAIAEIYNKMSEMRKRFKRNAISPDLVALISTIITIMAFLIAPFYASWLTNLF